MRNLPRDEERALARRLRQAIEQIRGVMSAKVVLDENDVILEIHLVGSSPRQPKRIVRDIESLLYARFGIRIDYRKISLAQLDSEGVSAVRRRLRFVSAVPHPQEANRVQVFLRIDKDRYEGVASLQADTSEEMNARSVADATLSAVRRAMGRDVPLILQEMQIIRTDEQRVCLSIVSATTPQGEERLAGTCLIADDLFEAACKATLDAINRRLPIWARRDAEEQAFPRNLPVSGNPGKID